MLALSRPQHGAALTSTMVFVLIALLALTGAFNRIHQLMALQESALRVPATSDGIAEALGYAVARMHTGVPSDTPYVCRVDLRASDGDGVLSFHVTHTRLADDRWVVSAAAGAAGAPTCPGAFESSCPLGAP
jgi:hypothetical protein